MGEKRYARDPLLYIHQPNISTPIAPMQYQYTTPKEVQEIFLQDKIETETKEMYLEQAVQSKPARRSYRQRSVDHEDDEQLYEIDTEGQEESDDGGDGDIEFSESENNTRQKFKNMTNEEKIDYFVSMPTYLPKMRCEIKTDERTYRGIVIGFEDNNVTMRVGKKMTSIQFDEIKQIRMLGFQQNY